MDRTSPQRRFEELQREIGRRRRRVDAHLVGLQREKQRLANWRTYVSHFPGTAALAALAAGFALSGALSFSFWQRWLGARLVSLTSRSLGSWLIGEAEYLWYGSGDE